MRDITKEDLVKSKLNDLNKQIADKKLSTRKQNIAFQENVAAFHEPVVKKQDEIISTQQIINEELPMVKDLMEAVQSDVKSIEYNLDDDNIDKHESLTTINLDQSYNVNIIKDMGFLPLNDLFMKYLQKKIKFQFMLEYEKRLRGFLYTKAGKSLNEEGKKEFKKYRDVFKHTFHNIGMHGKGLESSKSIKEYRYYNNGDDLVERLQVLIGESDAGNDNVSNEIDQILDKLREEGFISKDEHQILINKLLN